MAFCFGSGRPARRDRVNDSRAGPLYSKKLSFPFGPAYSLFPMCVSTLAARRQTRAHSTIGTYSKELLITRIRYRNRIVGYETKRQRERLCEGFIICRTAERIRKSARTHSRGTGSLPVSSYKTRLGHARTRAERLVQRPRNPSRTSHGLHHYPGPHPIIYCPSVVCTEQHRARAGFRTVHGKNFLAPGVFVVAVVNAFLHTIFPYNM